MFARSPISSHWILSVPTDLLAYSATISIFAVSLVDRLPGVAYTPTSFALGPRQRLERSRQNELCDEIWRKDAGIELLLLEGRRDRESLGQEHRR
jgi:hypothetical protein